MGGIVIRYIYQNHMLCIGSIVLMDFLWLWLFSPFIKYTNRALGTIRVALRNKNNHRISLRVRTQHLLFNTLVNFMGEFHHHLIIRRGARSSKVNNDFILKLQWLQWN